MVHELGWLFPTLARLRRHRAVTLKRNFLGAVAPTHVLVIGLPTNYGLDHPALTRCHTLYRLDYKLAIDHLRPTNCLITRILLGRFNLQTAGLES